MTFLRYPAYKDSGVEWLGEIPAHWETLQLKRRLYFDVGWTPPTGQSEYFDGDLPWANISDLGPHTITQTAKSISLLAVKVARLSLIPKGSLLFSFKLSIGQVSFAGIDLYSNEAIAAFPPQPDVDLRFMYYALPLYAVQNANENIYGAKLLNQDLIKNACILDVPLIEQRTIAAFLDTETARIDTLVAKQVSLIATLQEKRRALISHVVTKGLDPAAPMKDSGVPWLGDVPKHWEVRQLGRIGSFSKGGGGTKEDEVEDGMPCVRYGDLYTQYRFFIERTKACVSPEKALVYTPIHYGDVLFAGSGETIEEIGKSAVNLLTEPACCGGDVILFRPSISVDAKFFGYATDCPQAMFQKACMGRGFTVMHIYARELKYLSVALPPLPEQRTIAAFLDAETAHIDTLITKSQEMIAVLREHRTALVAAAVTGQIDVREPSRELGRIK